ncbi:MULTISPECIES: undecaprenyl-diphosphate phosphatase [Terrabacteria group]|uniref:undecaprenyl-diphosphate phosphatase n=1 Tax=Bacillati TaxID=1783272 RepID=UPI001C9339EF|nr:MULTISPECIES: undecaprenyl-diphosphate phosphatase [Terrabacteria group]
MAFIWNVFKAVLYGIMQGITEWLPISSTGHLILMENFLPLNVYADPAMNIAFWNLFKVVIQFGSILAVILLYWKKLTYPKKASPEKKKRTQRLWLLVMIASIPLVLGVVLDHLVDTVLSSSYVIATTLVIYGILFIWMEHREHDVMIDRIGYIMPKDALSVGLFQLLAVVPGTSRSGATIFGATWMGFDRKTATEFSFFMAIPAMFGASLLKMVKAKIAFSWSAIFVLLIGVVVSFLVSIVAIQHLLKYIRKHDFTIFGIYRIILGVIVLVFSLIGFIH